MNVVVIVEFNPVNWRYGSEDKNNGYVFAFSMLSCYSRFHIRNYVIKVVGNDSIEVNDNISNAITAITVEEALGTFSQTIVQTIESVNHLLEEYENNNGGVVLDGDHIIVYMAGEQQQLTVKLNELSKRQDISVQPVQHSLKQLKQT